MHMPFYDNDQAICKQNAIQPKKNSYIKNFLEKISEISIHSWWLGTAYLCKNPQLT